MIVLFPLWRRRWWVESVLDSDDRLDAARSHAVMNRPNKLVIPCKRARVLARSDQAAPRGQRFRSARAEAYPIARCQRPRIETRWPRGLARTREKRGKEA